MNKEKIETIFDKFGIEIKEIKSATNSFNSNVYIITSTDDKRYVLKFCNNEKKMLNESKYMKYLKHHLPVSDENEPLGQQKTYLQKYLQNKGFTDFGKSFFLNKFYNFSIKC